MAQCKAATSSGKPCKAHPGDSGYCFLHDPERKQQANHARSRGGRNAESIPESEVGAQPLTLESLRSTLASTINDLRCGKCDVKRAAEVANLARVQLKVIQAFNAENPGLGDSETKKMTEAELREMSLLLIEGGK